MKVLFLCSGNSARSVMAECILNREGGGRFEAYSAGPNPGDVHPEAVDLLTRLGYGTDQMRSKSWEEFCGPEAPALDFVVTLCDDTLKETCPFWEGQPVTAHWAMADPARAEGQNVDVALAFAEAYRQLSHRIGIFVNLPIAKLERISLQQHLDDIALTLPAAVVPHL